MTLLSIFSGGLWFIPLLTLAGALFFGYKGYKASKSNSTQQAGTVTNDNTGNVPFLKTGYGVFSIILAVATVVIIIAMNGDK